MSDEWDSSGPSKGFGRGFGGGGVATNGTGSRPFGFRGRGGLASEDTDSGSSKPGFSSRGGFGGGRGGGFGGRPQTNGGGDEWGNGSSDSQPSGGGFGSSRGGFGGGRGGGFGGRSQSNGSFGDSCENGSDETEIFVDQGKVGRIIGKGGSKIKELQDETGANIKVNRDAEDGKVSVVLTGSQDSRSKAKALIEELTDNGMSSGGGFGGGGFGNRSSRNEDSYGGSSEETEIFVEQGKVGRIIGKGGSKINELQDETGANIKVNRDAEDGKVSVVLSGSQDSRSKAKALIEELVTDGYGSSSGGGFGGGGGGFGGGFGNRPSRNEDSYGDGSEETEIFVEQGKVGRIIGKGGSKINELQDETGANIKVNRDAEDGKVSVVLSGSQDSRSKAKKLIEELVTDSYGMSSGRGGFGDSSGAPDGERPPPYIPPALTEDEGEIFQSIEKGINFDKYDNISVEVSGRDPCAFISSFDEAGLYPTFLRNVRKAKYEKPTPVQKYSIPIIAAGRDLMACAQTGSGKTAAFLLPTLTCMVKEGLSTSAFSETQEPQAIVVAPTRELVSQIHQDARKFSWGTEVRPVVVYGGTSVGYQLREVEKGAHMVCGTPGRLLDFIEKGKIGLGKVKFLILDEADRMLDMGFEPCIRKLVEQLGMPPKHQRQTLMFSATFPTEIQKLAADFLNDYLFLTVGRVGGANTDVEQHFFEVDRLQKREKLSGILTASGSDKTLVFVEQKRNADFLASYLSQSGFPTTSIHGDRMQKEREEALRDFKRGTAPILIATSVAARGLDIPEVKHVINYDLPSSIDEYVHRIGRTGRCGNLGKATSFYSNDSDSAIVKSLVRILTEAHQIVPDWLNDYALTSDGVIDHGSMPGQYGGKDIRRGKFGGGGGGNANNAWDNGGASAGGGGGGGDEEEWD